MCSFGLSVSNVRVLVFVAGISVPLGRERSQEVLARPVGRLCNKKGLRFPFLLFRVVGWGSGHLTPVKIHSTRWGGGGGAVKFRVCYDLGI